MKYALALLMLIALPVKAVELNIPVTCGPSEQYLEVIREEYGEELIWMSEGIAVSNGSKLYNSLWVNHKTQTWSFVVVNKATQTACVFTSGEGFQFFEPGESI